MEELQIDNSTSDADLIVEIIRTNSSELFAIIYDRYSEVVYHKCLSFVKNKEEAQDITHDIFVKLFLKIRTFKNQSKFSTWLYSFTYNHCVNHVQRDYNKRKDRFIDADDENQLNQVYEEIDDKDIFELNHEKFLNSLELLDPNDKSILFMKYQDDMTIEDIQMALDLGKSAVKMRLSRAKSKLLQIYKQL